MVLSALTVYYHRCLMSVLALCVHSPVVYTSVVPGSSYFLDIHVESLPSAGSQWFTVPGLHVFMTVFACRTTDVDFK